jgi:hypothetical protein
MGEYDRLLPSSTPRARVLLASVAALGLWALPTAATAHGGGTDSYGCHRNRRAGGYHCHRGPLAGSDFASKEAMLAQLQGDRPAKPSRSKPTPAGKAAQTTVGAILADKAAFDAQSVTLTCAAQNLTAKTSRKGNPYYTFLCDDGTGAITVFSFGAPPFVENDRVRVKGTFAMVKHVGRNVFHDQVDAAEVVKDRTGT